MTVRTVGVQEELLVVDADSGEPAPAAPQLTAARELEPQLQRQQVETDSSAVKTLAELRSELRGLRRSAARRARWGRRSPRWGPR